MVVAPSLEAERALWDRGKWRVVGVDEAGIGPLAGPVVAAAYLVPVDCRLIDGARDSKTLSPAQRERLFGEIMRQALAVGVGAASVCEIERLNILNAAHLAMRRALARVGTYDHALVDGREITNCELGPHTAIVDGDASSYAIACASIVAKVTRDRLMRNLAIRYPGFGWEHNAGYPTPEHLAALHQHGLTPFHRRTYAPVRAIIESSDYAPGFFPRYRPVISSSSITAPQAGGAAHDL